MCINLNNVSDFRDANISVLELNREIDNVKLEINNKNCKSFTIDNVEERRQISSEIDSLELRLFELESVRNSFIVKLNQLVRQSNPSTAV